MTAETVVAIAALAITLLMAAMTGYVSLLRYAFARAEGDLVRRLAEEISAREAGEKRCERIVTDMRTKHENETSACAVEIKGLQNRLKANDDETARIVTRCALLERDRDGQAKDVALLMGRVIYRRDSDPKTPASGGR